MTQVIADGLLILFLLSIVYLAYKFGVYVSKNRLKEPRDKLYKFRLFILPIIALLPIILFFFHYNKHQKINIHLLGAALAFSIIIIGYIVELIGRKRINKVLSNDWFLELIGPLLLVSMLIGSIYFTSFIFRVFHKSFHLPENLINLNYIECRVQNKVKKYEILYLNDKYIFVELDIKNGEKAIEIIEYNELFDENNCR